MVDTLRELLAGVGWSHVGLLVLVLIIGRLTYCAGIARGKVGWPGPRYERGRRW